MTEKTEKVTTYTDRLAAVNSTLNTTDIKGKEYVDVAQRIIGFYSLFPEGRIATKLLSDAPDRCVFMAAIYRNQQEEKPAVTGHAFETKQGRINSTSYIENCETSAVGRALGMLGIGSTSSIASADEVQAAIELQESGVQPKAKKKVPEEGGFNARCRSCGQRFHFENSEQYQTFLEHAGCCERPDWEVE